ncbi:chromatin associated protein KTI12, partial [Suillus lakei]
SRKTARTSLFTAITRHIARDTILIVDGMNYNKGFRYRFYCKAREASVIAMVCNGSRYSHRITDAIEKGSLNALIQCFENQWSAQCLDAPLFAIPWDDLTPDAVTTGTVKSPNVGTQITPKAPTDALRMPEHTTNALVSVL